MMGERVAVLRRMEGAVDEMGDPIATWSAEEVDGVLVRPLGGSDVGDGLHPDGVRVEYRLAFPKRYTASCGPLRGARIALIERGMDPSDHDAALRVSGSPDVTRPCPTRWDVLADVGRADG